MSKIYDDRVKKIKAEEQALLEYFGNTTNELALRLIQKASFMHVTLTELQDTINKNGVKEEYQNGANQKGFKDSVEVKTYKDMIKNYTAVIKQLNDMIPTSKATSSLEAFKEF